MNPAYRLPVGKFPIRDRFITQETAVNTPITEIVVNSLITSHRDGDKIKAGKTAVSGLAWDGGYGIRSVDVSTDGGKTWAAASLGQDLGPFAFRPWSFNLAAKKGKNTVMVNATNKLGQTPNRRADLQPGRLPQQRDAKHHAQRLRERTMRTFAFVFAAALIALPAAASAEQAIKLKPGPGMDKTEANCQACHSLSYIPMNSPFLSAAGWDGEVNKMIKVMGAPIDDADAKAIKDYLAKNYAG